MYIAVTKGINKVADQEVTPNTLVLLIPPELCHVQYAVIEAIIPFLQEDKQQDLAQILAELAVFNEKGGFHVRH